MKTLAGSIVAVLLTVGVAAAQNETQALSNQQSTVAPVGSPQNLARIYTRPQPPPQSALDPLNLVMAWRAYVPMAGRRDGILTVQLFGSQLFVQTRSGAIVALDANDGMFLWQAQPGMPFRAAYPLGYNGQLVFAVRDQYIYALNRRTGVNIWRLTLPQGPNATPSADDQRVYPIMGTGHLQVWDLRPPDTKPPLPPPAPLEVTRTPTNVGGSDPYREMRKRESLGELPPVPPTPAEQAEEARDPYREMRVRENAHGSISAKISAVQEAQPVEPPPPLALVYEYTAEGRLEQPGLLVGRHLVLATYDGVFIVLDRESKKIEFSFRAQAPISAPASQYGNFAYVASEDLNVYSVDVAAGQIVWRFVAGAPIIRRPIATDTDVYVSPEERGLFRLDRKTGRMIWRNRDVYRMLAENRKFVYADDRRSRVVVLDRARGTALGMLDTRDFVFPVTNDITDRLILAANDGLIVCLHDRETPVPYIANHEALRRSAYRAQPQPLPTEDNTAIPAPTPKKPAGGAQGTPKNEGG